MGLNGTHNQETFSTTFFIEVIGEKMTAALRHQCRYCRTKLFEPTDNLYRAFCCRGCHTSFYRSRCLVCEEPIRRKNERQRFGSGHKRCQGEYRRFPHRYDHSGYHPSQNARGPLKNPIKPVIKEGNSDDRGCPLGWRWEFEEWEHRLLDREGNLTAHLWLVGNVWYLSHPQTIPPFQPRLVLDAAKRLAVSMALANLPLDQKTVDRMRPENAAPVRYLPMGNLTWAATGTVQSDWKPAGYGLDIPNIPDLLRRESSTIR
jgi:hypothetical protein